MSADWNAFTPWTSLASCVLIGFAAALFVLLALGMGELKAEVFDAAMLAGMGLYELLERRRG